MTEPDAPPGSDLEGSVSGTPTLRDRRSARAVLLNAAGEVLLIRFAINRAGKPFHFWATPGGEIERGESEIDAARRELREEIGLDIALVGPIHYSTSYFELEGAPVRNTDAFFAGFCDVRTPQLRFATEAERNAMRGIQWWSVDALERAEEPIFPVGLVSGRHWISRR